MPLRVTLDKLKSKSSLTLDESRQAFDVIFEGKVPAEQIGLFLRLLYAKGETADEIQGAVVSMRSKALTITAPARAIDIVGTGGDGIKTLNISTATALVVAACGVPVAKHGNRAATSLSGSSDVLSALGVNLEPPFELLEECLHKANLCFLFAPRHHPAMRHVAEVRKKLGIRTIFNLLGPLTNPANVRRHLIGVFESKWMPPMAKVLAATGSDVAWLTHGHDGMDELSTTAANDVTVLEARSITSFTLQPADAGLPVANLIDLKGGDATYNARELVNILDGAKNAYRDIVVLNAAAALVVAGEAADLKHGVKKASVALDCRAAYQTLHKIVEITNRKPA